MITLLLLGTLGISIEECKAEFPGDKFVGRICEMPDMTMEKSGK